MPAVVPQRAAGQTPPPPVKIAVFPFELEDLTPASALLGASTSSHTTLERATAAARESLTGSGRYSVVDVSAASAAAPPAGGWRACDGCEAAAAAKLGADQSLLGIVRRATQTDYYVTVEIRDAHTGKVLDQEAANFAGDETGWATGVRMLMKHQVLVADSPPADSPAAASPAAASPAVASPPASEPASATPAPPHCKVATVNPVSGYAECVDPRGAPVSQLPRDVILSEPAVKYKSDP
ncbi:MAG TPA: DUF2380 domain-containing protein [Steroidobacteraceae bacterium]|nr:DUF2380 domain-containing protein [Steroidobacteraceae bacterium]